MRHAGSQLNRGMGALLPVLGLVALLASRTASPHAPRAASGDTRTLALTPQARRYLALQFRAFATEFMGCMIRDVRGAVVLARGIPPADVVPPQPTQHHVMPKRTSERAGG